MRILERIPYLIVGVVVGLLVGISLATIKNPITSRIQPYGKIVYEYDTIYSKDTVWQREIKPTVSEVQPIKKSDITGIPVEQIQINYPDRITVCIDSTRTYYDEHKLYNGLGIIVKTKALGYVLDQEIGYTSVPTITKRSRVGLYVGATMSQDLYASLQLKYKRNLLGFGYSPTGKIQFQYHYSLFGD